MYICARKLLETLAVINGQIGESQFMQPWASETFLVVSK